MKFGIMFVNSGPFINPTLLAHLAKTAEEVGFESLWVVEHVVVPQAYKSRYPYSRSGRMPGGEEVPILDPFVALSWIAAHTTRIKLATGVLILPQRHPLYVAKEAASLDNLSQGRVILGVGSGWLKEEFEALNVDFHTRGTRTDESIQALRALWRERPASFHGRHFSFGPVFSIPQPVQSGGIPIHIGGHSVAAARRAARLGDGFFPAISDTASLETLFNVMRQECEKLGRNPAELELTCAARLPLDKPDQYYNLGVRRLVVAPPAYDRDGISRELEKFAKDVISKEQT